MNSPANIPALRSVFCFDTKTTWNSYDWSMNPIDGIDAVSKNHDLDQERIGTFNWLEDTRTLPGDKEAIKGWDKYVREYDGTGKIDQYTGRTASMETIRNGQEASIFFGVMTRYKEWKIQKLIGKDMDPNLPAYMKSITIDDYKGEWWQFKRNAEFKILKSASDAPK